jgi:hypothetical protein
MGFFGSPAKPGVVAASIVRVGRQLQLAGVVTPCVANEVPAATRRQ